MIYLFTGQPGSGKTTLAKKLQMWLQTDKKNVNVFNAAFEPKYQNEINTS